MPLLFLAEQTKAHSKLNGIDAGIRSCKTGVGNMHVADFRADVVSAAQKVKTQSAARSEINMRCSFGDFRIGKKSAAANLKIGNDAAVRGQRPFESEGVYAGAVGSIRFLSYQKDWDGIDCIFQPAAEKPGTVRRGKDQAVAEAHVPHAVAGLAAIKAMPAAGPNLPFMFTLDRPGLAANRRDIQEYGKDENHKDSLHRSVSSGLFDSSNRGPGAEKI